MVRTVLIHGGAGLTPKTPHQEIKTTLDTIAHKSLNYTSALDIVQNATSFMEDSGIFNAGIGSILTHDGTIEMDAGIMDGSTLNSGAVAAVSNIKNPINLARKVLDSKHSLLTSIGAETFAKTQGIALEKITPTKSIKEKYAHDTVGAIAVDDLGNIAVATSTGGIWKKIPGRVGDSPLVGSGFYACKKCACVATGTGEDLMKIVISKSACDLMLSGQSPQQAANSVIKQLNEINGEGGVITMFQDGEIGAQRNVEFMETSHYTK